MQFHSDHVFCPAGSGEDVLGHLAALGGCTLQLFRALPGFGILKKGDRLQF